MNDALGRCSRCSSSAAAPTSRSRPSASCVRQPVPDRRARRARPRGARRHRPRSCARRARRRSSASRSTRSTSPPTRRSSRDVFARLGDFDLVLLAFGVLGDQDAGRARRAEARSDRRDQLHRRRCRSRVPLVGALRTPGPRHARRALVRRRRAGPAVELRLRLPQGRARRVLPGPRRQPRRHRRARAGRPARLRAHQDDRGHGPAPLSTDARGGRRRDRRRARPRPDDDLGPRASCASSCRSLRHVPRAGLPPPPSVTTNPRRDRAVVVAAFDFDGTLDPARLAAARSWCPCAGAPALPRARDAGRPQLAGVGRRSRATATPRRSSLVGRLLAGRPADLVRAGGRVRRRTHRERALRPDMLERLDVAPRRGPRDRDRLRVARRLPRAARRASASPRSSCTRARWSTRTARLDRARSRAGTCRGAEKVGAVREWLARRGRALGLRRQRRRRRAARARRITRTRSDDAAGSATPSVHSPPCWRRSGRGYRGAGCSSSSRSRWSPSSRPSRSNATSSPSTAGTTTSPSTGSRRRCSAWARSTSRSRRTSSSGPGCPDRGTATSSWPSSPGGPRS